MALQPHSAAQQKEYEREIRLQYGPDIVKESNTRWNNYTQAERDAILAEGGQVYADLAQAIRDGKPVNDSDVQAMLVRWHDNMRHFYEPSIDILRGLGEMYTSDDRFRATFAQFHPELADYLRDAIVVYVDDLETAAISRLLADDDAQRGLS